METERAYRRWWSCSSKTAIRGTKKLRHVKGGGDRYRTRQTWGGPRKGSATTDGQDEISNGETDESGGDKDGHAIESVKLVQLRWHWSISSDIRMEFEKDCWSQFLALQLTGKAALPTMDSGDYEAIKTAILACYEESYRQRFRTAARRDGETNRELMDMQRKWPKECKTMVKMQEVIGIELFFAHYPWRRSCG